VGFKLILEKRGYPYPRTVLSDFGGEFTGQPFQSFLKKYNISTND